MVSIPSNRVLPSVLRNDKITTFKHKSQSPQIGSYLRLGDREWRNGIVDSVSIPSNRVLPSVRQSRQSRNNRPTKSQSPQIGSYLRLERNGIHKSMDCAVSIPSNRVLPSVCHINRFNQELNDSLNPLKSGPTFGWRVSWQRTGRIGSLNPLKSGPTFGYKSLKKEKILRWSVSIPSNRVLPSVS